VEEAEEVWRRRRAAGLRDAELQVGLVFLRERGKVDVDVGQVAPLARAKLDRVDNLARELALCRVDLLNLVKVRVSVRVRVRVRAR